MENLKLDLEMRGRHFADFFWKNRIKSETHIRWM